MGVKSLVCGVGQGGGNPRVMGTGSLREAGEEWTGSGISEGGWSQEKQQKFLNIGTIFRNRKSTQRRELLWKGTGTGSAGCGRREAGSSDPPVPLLPTSPIV